MGKLVSTKELILSYGKRGKLVYDTGREPELKIPGFNAEYVPETPAPVARASADLPKPIIQSGNEIINPNKNFSNSVNALKRIVSAPLAALSNHTTQAGTALRDRQTARAYTPLLHAGETFSVPSPDIPGAAEKATLRTISPAGSTRPDAVTSAAPKAPSVTVTYGENQSTPEARADFRLMTDAERDTARAKSGAELGAYINSLDLSSRRRAAEAETRAKTASAFEANTDKAFRRESPEGRAVAAYVTGNSAYAVGKVQGFRSVARDTDARRELPTVGEALSGRRAAYEYLTPRQRETVAKYAEAGDFEAVAGIFPRTMQEGTYSELFYSDSLKFVDRLLEGLLLKWRSPRLYAELGCDWMGKLGYDRRERFQIFSAGEWKEWRV